MTNTLVVFISGPYRAPTEWQVVQNIRAAENLALKIWRPGVAVICPHKNTAFFGGIHHDDVWLDGDLELVKRSDAIVCAPGWEKSVGAKGEIDYAKKLSIPVFFACEEFENWLNSHQSETDDLCQEDGT